MQNVVFFVLPAFFIACTAFTLLQLLDWDMQPSKNLVSLLWFVPAVTQAISVDLSWHPPEKSWINDLSGILNGTGTHGFFFNGSALPQDSNYGTYNWCNMPHVRREEYPIPDSEYVLQYVEVVSRMFAFLPIRAMMLIPADPPSS
jgi:hypothetical protein